MKLFVWDFHGVLEKDNERAFLELANLVLREHGYSERFSLDEVYALYGKKMWELFAYLLPTEQPEQWHGLSLAVQEHRLHPQIVQKHIQANDGAEELLKAIHHNHRQILLSNTPPTGLSFFLEAVKLVDYFPPEYQLAADMHNEPATNKTVLLGRFLRRQPFQEVVIIGDTASDMNLKTVAPRAVTYLYSHPHLPHPECIADYKIRDLREIMREV